MTKFVAKAVSESEKYINQCFNTTESLPGANVITPYVYGSYLSHATKYSRTLIYNNYKIWSNSRFSICIQVSANTFKNSLLEANKRGNH